ncbi:TPA: hypothetical protein U1D18_001718, partial [Streptococcus suis]|nr:hypothetical protein [Streptococcus suis]
DTYYKYGVLDGQLKIARQMFLEGFDLETIARLTGLSEEDLIAMKADFE